MEKKVLVSTLWSKTHPVINMFSCETEDACIILFRMLLNLIKSDNQEENKIYCFFFLFTFIFI